jgi:hypothetical protein
LAIDAQRVRHSSERYSAVAQNNRAISDTLIGGKCRDGDGCEN